MTIRRGERKRSLTARCHLLPFIAALLLLFGCRQANDASSHWTFDDLFSVQAEIPLEYTDSSVVVSVQGNMGFCGDRILVGDSGGRQVLMFNKKGKFVRRIGKAGNGAGVFGNPSRVCITTNGQIFVYDQDHNSVLLYDTAANLLCSRRLGLWNIYQCGASGDRVITVGHEFNQETSAAAYYWSNCTTTRIGDFTSCFGYPRFLRMVIMSYQIPVLTNGDFCLLDEGTFRITKISKEGKVLRESDRQPLGFQGPEHDLIAFNNDEAHMAAEKAHALVSFCHVSGCLIVVWWDHQQFFIEIYDTNLVPKVTRLAIPNTLYPFISSDGVHLYLIKRYHKAVGTSPLHNPTLVMFSLATKRVS
jgi:hypothetical protein